MIIIHRPDRISASANRTTASPGRRQRARRLDRTQPDHSPSSTGSADPTACPADRQLFTRQPGRRAIDSAGSRRHRPAVPRHRPLQADPHDRIGHHAGDELLRKRRAAVDQRPPRDGGPFGGDSSGSSRLVRRSARRRKYWPSHAGGISGASRSPGPSDSRSASIGVSPIQPGREEPKSAGALITMPMRRCTWPDSRTGGSRPSANRFATGTASAGRRRRLHGTSKTAELGRLPAKIIACAPASCGPFGR